MMQEFGFHRLHPNAVMPFYGTEQAACFDISCHLADKYDIARSVKMISDVNTPHAEYGNKTESGVVLPIKPGYTALIPTGLVAKMPSGYSLRIHVRSGIALKRGLCLANGEGVIDSDYYDELFLMIRNTSKGIVCIEHGERICQGEWMKDLRFPIAEIHSVPQRTTDRVGGFGSTGV